MATTVEHMPPEAAAALPQPSTQEGATQQPEPGAPPARDKPREPLSAGTVAGIAAALICALLTVLGIASVAAFNALRDDIGQVRAEIGELRTETKDGIKTLRTELKGDIEALRAENREQFAEVYVILRDHGERLTGIEAELHTHSERLTSIEAELHTNGERLARLEAAHPHPASQ